MGSVAGSAMYVAARSLTAFVYASPMSHFVMYLPRTGTSPITIFVSMSSATVAEVFSNVSMPFWPLRHSWRRPSKACRDL